MSTPADPSAPQDPSTLTAPAAAAGSVPPTARRRFGPFRRLGPKDIAILALVLSFFGMSAYAFRDPLASIAARLSAGSGETVSVFDVVVDRQGRQYFDVLFDKPLGRGRWGGSRSGSRRSFRPLGGSWKWQDTNALRFSPAAGCRSPASSRWSSSRARWSRRGRSSAARRSSRSRRTSSWSKR